jgi:hypothetical protein
MAMFFDHMSADEVLRFFFSVEFDGGAGQCHTRKSVDSHILGHPPFSAILFFALGLQVSKLDTEYGF